MKRRILVVEDEKHIAEGLKLNLELEGYEVILADDGFKAINTWKEVNPDLIVLDIMLPGIDGISVLQNIRLENEKIPILILSAKNTEKDKIEGLKYGVDDYLAKPFNLDEFLLRIERLIKRASWNRNEIETDETSSLEQLYLFGTNEIDFANRTAKCKNGKINLTGQEVKLLKLFLSNKGKPLSRNKLLEIGWGYTKDMTTRTVDNFMVRIRRYFEEDPKKPKYFQSRRSIGYIFDDKEDES
ncbi:MAG: response regulator transcription factor [Desulfobacterales bacterium]|nr:response regulator transcription factor [Desulfobacterales bacterium]MCP4161307.1 response regulator transcription factor [Deltaproteobacteria bacterium]